MWWLVLLQPLPLLLLPLLLPPLLLLLLVSDTFVWHLPTELLLTSL